MPSWVLRWMKSSWDPARVSSAEACWSCRVVRSIITNFCVVILRWDKEKICARSASKSLITDCPLNPFTIIYLSKRYPSSTIPQPTSTKSPHWAPARVLTLNDTVEYLRRFPLRLWSLSQSDGALLLLICAKEPSTALEPHVIQSLINFHNIWWWEYSSNWS